ncbi:MAG: RING finger protein [Chloroflexota bacterium]
MIRAHHIGESSTFLGQTCALCKQEFAAGDEIVICPDDGSRHHVRCWQANGNKCTAYGCRGEGAVGTPVVLRRRGRPSPEPSSHRPRVITQEPERSRADSHTARPIPNAPGSKVRTLPAGSVGCARSCLLLAVALAIVLFAVGCFGLWAIADYLMLQVWDLPYRLPLSEGLIFLLSLSRL